MPSNPVLTTLKTVSEAVLGLLTLLLQIMVRQLETAPNAEENEDPHNAEVIQTMETMNQELQNQRSLLQGVLMQLESQSQARQQPSASRSALPPASPARVNPVPALPAPGSMDPANVSMSSPLVAQLLREAVRRMPVEENMGPEHLPVRAPSVAAGSVSGVPAPGSVRSSSSVGVSEAWEAIEELTNHPPAPLPAAVRQGHHMTVAEWGQSRITWGRKHKGKTYQQVLREDIEYFHWSQKRYPGLQDSQQDFVRYCQVQLGLDRN